VDPLDIIAGTADAAFATDEGCRITIWNRAAERLLGYEAAQILGQPCHEFLCGRDVFGNRFCDGSCPPSQMIRRREALHHFEMDVRKASGETIRAAFSLVVVPGPRRTQYTLIHLFQPVDRSRESDELIRRILATSPAPGLPPQLDAHPSTAPIATPLTAREIEVLRLMAEGISTSRMADSMFISVTTVRTHVQNILRKHEVHSKLEAVSLALRNHLI
jgi:DNA-binding CsgD family transcriptional regulator